MRYSMPKVFIGLLFFLCLFLVLFIYFHLTKPVYAATATWTNGGGDGLWSTCANWSGGTGAGGCPGSSDVATFDGGTSNASVQIDTNINVQGINITNGYSGTVTQNSTRTVTIGSAGYSQSSGTFSGGDSEFTISDGDFTLADGSFTPTSGTFSVERNFNVTDVDDFVGVGKTITFSGTSGSDDTTLTCSGTLTGSVNITKTSTSGSFTLSNGCSITFVADVDTAGSIINNGTISATNINIESDLTQNGTLTMSGTLVFDGNSSLSDSVFTCAEVFSPTVNITKTSLSGDFILSSGCSITLAASVDTSGSITNNGTMNATNINTEADFTQNGTFNLTGVLTFDGSSVSSDTVLTCSEALDGVVNVAKGSSSASFTVSSNCTVSFQEAISTEGSIINNGTINHNSGSPTLDIDDSFTNNNGATYNYTGAAITIERDFTQNGTFDLSGVAVSFDQSGSGDDSTVTCSGNLGGTIVIDKNGSDFFRVASGCVVDTVDINPTSIEHIQVDGTLNVSGSTFNVNNGSLIVNASGEVTYAGTAIEIERDLTLAGTFELAGKTITFDSVTNSDDSTVTCTGTLAATVVIAKTSATSWFRVADGCTVNTVDVNPTSIESLIVDGTINISGSTFNLEDGDFILNATGIVTYAGTQWSLEGDYIDNGGTFNQSGKTLTIDGAGIGENSSVTCASSLGGLTINKDFAPISFLSNCILTGSFTRTNGTINNPASPFVLEVQDDFSMSTSDAFGGANLTLRLSGGNSQTITQNAGVVSGPFEVNKSGNAASLSTSFTTDSTCNVVEGAFDTNGNTFTCGSTFTVEDGGTLELFGNETVTSPTLSDGSTVRYTGNGTGSETNYTIKDYAYYHLAVASTDAADTFATPNSTEDVNGDFSLSGGVFTAPSGNFTIAGNFAHTGGTFTHNSGTVALDGSGQTVSGSTTFNNFTKTVTSAQTLTFAAGSTQTVAGTLTLDGDPSQLLSLRSSSEDTQWSIDPQSTRTLGYLDVQDSNNTNATFINATGTNSTNSGNNTNWDFNNPNGPSSLGPAEFTNGGVTIVDQSGLTFTVTDDDSADQVRYRVQFATDSGFTALVVDYTSGLSVQGGLSFDVGQAEGSGTYAIGTSGQTLAAAEYYWRVMGIDEYGLESSWVAANSGNVAFQVATPTPTPTNTPTPTPTSAVMPTPESGSPGSSSSSDSAQNSSVCSLPPPTSSPDLFQTERKTTSVTLYFTTAKVPVDSYVISYGLSQTAEGFGTSFSESGEPGVIQYSVGALSPNTIYYFKVRGGNGCATGDWSEIVAIRTLGVVTSLTRGEEKEIEEYVERQLPNTSEKRKDEVKKELKEKAIEKKSNEQNIVEQVEKPSKSLFGGIFTGIKSGIYTVLSPLKNSLVSTSSQVGRNIAITIDAWFDTEPTIITNVKVAEKGSDFAIITWETNHYATSKVNYGDSYDYGRDVQSTNKVKKHEVKIANLKPGTTYYYEVMSQGNNYVYDARHEFTTKK